MITIIKLFIIIICIYLLILYLTNNYNNNFCYILVFCKNNLTKLLNNYYNRNQTNDLFNFINTLIKPKNNIINLNNTDISNIKINDILYNKILLYFNYIFNTGKYFFNNILISNNIYYYKNTFGKYIKSIIITSDVNLIENNNNILKITMILECFIYDNIYSYASEDNIIIISIELINDDIKNTDTITLDTFIPQCNNIDNINTNNNIDISSSIDISNSNIFNSDNSLIPSSINISEL